MSTLLYGRQVYSEPADGADAARSTITVVDNESPTPEATTDPEYNHVEHDPDTEGGLTTRDVGPITYKSEQYSRLPGNANTDFAAPINAQVSSSGHAASQEDSGRWGHGTTQWSDSTEPTIREGGNFTDVYFSAKRPTIQDGSLDMMTVARNPDDGTAQATQAASIAAARKATANMYQAFLDDRTG